MRGRFRRAWRAERHVGSHDQEDLARLASLFEHQHRVRSYVRARVSCPDAVDDIVAETYTVAWRRLQEIPATDLEVGWLCGVARNLVRNHVRGETRRRRLLDRAAGHMERTATHSSSDGAPGLVRLLAEDAWTGLAKPDRQLLACAAAGLSHDEIAALLKLTPGTVAMRLFRARSRLEAALAEEAAM